MSLLTVEQLHAFHAQDRAIFAKLVLKFSRAPAKSLLVMATWFWLEDFGFENIFSVIMSLSDPFIVSLADEAVSCFRCLESNEPENGFNRIPLTAGFMTKDIYLRIIYEYRYSAIIGIKNFLSIVCSRIFSDIIQRVLPSLSSSSYFTRLCGPLKIPGFPHPTFGNIIVMPHVVSGNNLSNNNLFIIPSGLWGWHATCIATENDQTIFLTFSHGFLVSVAEVKKLFTEEFGENCVVGVFIPEETRSTKMEKALARKNHYTQGWSWTRSLPWIAYSKAIVAKSIRSTENTFGLLSTKIDVKILMSKVFFDIML